MNINFKQCHKAIREMFDLSKFEHPMAVTLTLKPGIFIERGYIHLTQEAASKDLRHFLNVLSRKILKQSQFRKGKRLPCFPVYESKNVSPHFHLVLDKPKNISNELFHDWARRTWHKTTFGNKQVDIKPCDFGWATYITKLRTKDNYIDSIDWNNFHQPDSVV